MSSPSSSSSICSEMMRSIILDPENKPDFLKEEDHDFVEVSEGDTTLLGSSDDDDGDDVQPGKDSDKRRRKDATTLERDPEKQASPCAQDDVDADKRIKSSNNRQLSPSSSLTTVWDAATDAETAASKWASVFRSTGSIAEESDDFDHIQESEAEGTEGDERAARIEKAKAIQRRRNELRKIAPAPEQIKCPCLTDGKDGWKVCQVPAHRELGRLTSKGFSEYEQV